MALTENENTLAAATAAFGAAAPFVAWVTTKLFKKLTEIIHRFDKVSVKVDKVEEKIDSVSARVKKIEPLAETVAKEFLPNGGTSMRDAINWLERKFSVLECQHRTRFDGDGLATYECDAAGMCTYASAALAELYGRPAEQFLGTEWLRAVSTSEERERVWRTWLYAVQHGTPYEDIYTVIAHGKPLRIRTYTRVAKGRKGEPLCYFGVVTPAQPDSKLLGGGTTTGASGQHTALPQEPPGDGPG